MGGSFELMRHEPRARTFFFAHAQSSLGTGAGYVALLLVAYERFHSPWAITLILLADFLPPMLLAPFFGAAADRWSRRTCAVAADLLRGAAFAGLAFVGGLGPTLALALLAGAGTGLFRPAILAALPGLVRRDRTASANGLYGAIENFGHTAGPLLAAGALLLVAPEALLLANGITFALSAMLVARIPFAARADDGAADEPGEGEPTHQRGSFLGDARAGLAVARRAPGVRAIILSSSAVVLFAGLFNVGELLLATNVLGAGGAGFSILVAVFGLGVVAGSLAGGREAALTVVTRRYLAGLLVVATGMLATGLAPAFWVAVATFALTGVGNGLVVVHERMLLQRLVGDAFRGRVFAAADGLAAWAFGIAFVSAGAITALLGARALFLLAGAGALIVWAGAWLALRNAFAPSLSPEPAPAIGDPAPAR